MQDKKDGGLNLINVR